MGCCIQIESSVSPILDEQDEIIGFLAIQKDITEWKKMVADLTSAKEKAEESGKLKTAFLNNISHEIRTPMNAIIGFTLLLSENDLESETQSTYIQTIQESSNQLLSIINDIVDISSIEANIIKTTVSPVNINYVLRSLAKQFKFKASENSNTLTLSLGLNDQKALIQTDSTKLIQIISNLLNNSLKFTKKGKVDFGYTLRDSLIEFFVIDSGIGIPSEHHSKIFDSFYQVRQEPFPTIWRNRTGTDNLQSLL